MTLVDTGPLVSLVDKANAELHRKCLAAAGTLRGALLTTWPCLTEAMYLLGQAQGWKSQDGLWQMVEHGAVVLHIPNDNELNRIRDLMRQYEDTPMDFADASLVALAEATGLRKIFTLDSDFYHYRINGKDSFDVISLVAA